MNQADRVLLTERKMQEHCATRWLHERYEFLLSNHGLGTGCIFDLLGFRPSGFADEIEIKLSVDDFRADFKKRNGHKHRDLETGTCKVNYFYFFMPADIAERVVIPDYAGLMVYSPEHERRAVETKRAPRLHSKKRFTDANRMTAARHMATKYWAQRCRWWANP